MSCDICYEPLIKKVLLECKHELCVKCFLEMKPKKDFKCHMCRKEYKFIKEKQCITAPNTTIDNIIIIEEDEFSLRALIQQRFPNECCLSFKVKKDIMKDYNILFYVHPLQRISKILLKIMF